MALSFVIDGFKDSFGIDGVKDGDFKVSFRNGFAIIFRNGFKVSFRDGFEVIFRNGFKVSFGIVWLTPMLFLLIEFLPFGADF